MTVAEKLESWLDSIGADGLMSPKWGEALIWEKEYIELSNELSFPPYVVPAYRHADGTWHAEAEAEEPCEHCRLACTVEQKLSCHKYTDWLSHKGKPLSDAYRAKCAEVEELKKALIHISELTSETAGGPWTKDIHNCTRKALEGKE